MTALKVVDASAIAALLFGEPAGPEVVRRLDGASLAAPPLLEYELANVCLIKRRRHPEQRDALVEALRLSRRMGIQLVQVDQMAVFELAEALRLTAYDAAYLWLARRLGAELVSLDAALIAADAR